MVGLGVRLRALGAEVRVCAPPDSAERLAEVGLPLVPVGQPVRPMGTGATPPSAADLPRRAVELVAAQSTRSEAAEGCDALVAGGLMPVAERSVTEKLGIRYVYASYQPITLPSPHRSPLPRPGRPFPPEVTDNRALWDLDAQGIKELFGGAQHPPGLDRPAAGGQRPRPHLHRRPVAGDGSGPEPVAGADVVQTGAWIVPDERPLPAELVAFLDAGTPPVYVGFGSMAMQTPAVRAPKDLARVAIEAIRAQGRRALVSRGWADLALIDDRDDCFGVGEVNQQALFGRVAAVVHHGGAARRRRPSGPACLRWWYPRRWTSHIGPAGWPSWASARHTTVRLRPPSPCQPRSGRP
jgi:vancomycin aglycone glucosyltransferase